MSELASGKLLLDEPAEGVARLTIDNLGKRNALDLEILDAMAETLPGLDARCVIITGAERVFSAGYDIGDLPPDEFAERAESLVAHPFAEAIEALETYPYPTVAALNGHAIGGGLEVALACDLRVAALEARMGMPPAKLGLIYSHTGLRKFIDAVGVPRARELFLVGRNIDAERALDWGLVNSVHHDDELEQAAIDLGRRDRGQRTALARRQQAGDPGADQGRVEARPGGRGRARGAAALVLPLGGLPGGRAGLRREAPARLEGAVVPDRRCGEARQGVASRA